MMYNKFFDKWNKINPEYLREKIVERNSVKIRYSVINFKYFKNSTKKENYINVKY